MPSLSCMLWLLFLGAALAGPLYWLLRRRRARAAPPGRPAVPDPGSGILYLSPACIRALRACAAPERLRTMSDENIERRLKRGRFTDKDPMPTPERYGSWRQQATLLCAGRYAELAQLQRDLIAKYGAPPVPPQALPVAPAPARQERGDLPRFLALMLAFLLLALVAYVVAGRCKPPPAPVCPEKQTCPVVPVPTVSTIELSSDMLFDYNKDRPISDAHERNAKAQLRDLLAQHEHIEILSIEGHTDPIGSTSFNRSLGARRAAYVGTLLAALMPGHAGGKAPQELASAAGSGPNRDDFEIWRACYAAYFQPGVAKQGWRPLDNLPASLNDGRIPCRQATLETGREDGRYPACRRAPSDGTAPKDYAQRAERLRELIACLAPMRHVKIRFRSQRLVPAAAAAPGQAAPSSR